MKDKILVIGGTGKTGRRVAERLKNKGLNVRIGARSQTPAFDWQDENTWRHALTGMDKVYITYYPDLAVPGAFEAIERLVQIAKEEQVQKLVLLSGLGEKEAERCEQLVANSGLEYVLVRASWFNQNFSESFFAPAIVAGQIALPMAEAEIPFVDTDDIADVVTEVLLNEVHNGQTYEITGPDLLTFSEVIDEIAGQLGKDIKFQALTLAENKALLESQGLPADYIWLFDYLFREVLSNKANARVRNDVQKVLGRPAKSFAAYVREVVDAGGWK